MQSRENHLAGIVRRLVGAGQESEERQRSDAEQLANRLASFPEYNPNPVVETDLDGNVTYLNPAAQELFGERYARGSFHPLARDLGPTARQAHARSRWLPLQGSGSDGLRL